MQTKFVAYTQALAEARNGTLIKHVIAPVDVNTIPPEVQALFPDDLDAQIQYVGVDPEDLEEIVGVFDDYLEASRQLSRRNFWRKNGTPARRRDTGQYEVYDTTTGTVITRPVEPVMAVQIRAALNTDRDRKYAIRPVQA